MEKKSAVQADAWNAHLYDKKHSFVSHFGKELLDLLSPREGERILDVGCGTGDLAYQIHQAGATVCGIDSSAAMIKHARLKYPALTFQAIDAREMAFANQFDAVFSNAALHWMQPPDIVLKNIWSSLKPGGRFIAELGGKGNINSIMKAIAAAMEELNYDLSMLNCPWYFPSLGEYTTLMEDNGFRVNYAIYFDRPTLLEGKDGLKNWLAMFGGGLLSNIPEEMSVTIIARAEKLLETVLLNEGQWVADYKRVRVAGTKEI